MQQGILPVLIVEAKPQCWTSCVQAQNIELKKLNAMVNNSAVSTGLPSNAVMLQYIISEVDPSHVMVVVMQERWCRNIYGDSSGTMANGAVHNRNIIRIFPAVRSRQEIHLFAVKPTLSK